MDPTQDSQFDRLEPSLKPANQHQSTDVLERGMELSPGDGLPSALVPIQQRRVWK